MVAGAIEAAAGATHKIGEKADRPAACMTPRLI